MKRHIHYEAAFEDFVRSRGWPYVPVDERRRAVFSDSRVKSFDFLVYPPNERAWLVDIKGRQFPYSRKNGQRFWENWIPRVDLCGLDRWRMAFGDGFEPGIVFAYWIREGAAGKNLGEPHSFAGNTYCFLWISASDYAVHARNRSPKWETVTVPVRTFRDLVREMPGCAEPHRGFGLDSAESAQPR